MNDYFNKLLTGMSLEIIVALFQMLIEMLIMFFTIPIILNTVLLPLFERKFKLIIAEDYSVNYQ